MLDGSYRMGFPGPYGRRTGHDLADYGLGLGSLRLGSYAGLRRRDEPVAWGFIEENYFSKYGGFLRVDFDWIADGLWEIPIPGSVGLGASVSPEYFGMPEPSAARVHAWQADLDSPEPGAEPAEEGFDYGASDAEGPEIAREVKLHLGEDYHAESGPFPEIATRDGGTVELEVPRFTGGLAR